MRRIYQIIDFFFQKKWLGILLIAGLVWGVGISTFYRGAVSPKQRTDLTVYLKAGEVVAEGRSEKIYETENVRHWNYVYSPLLAILLAPVSKWPIGINVTLAYALSIACLAGTVLLSRRFPGSVLTVKTGRQTCTSVPAPSPEYRTASRQIALSMIFCLPILLNTLTRGQLGIITLFFMAAIFYSYLAEHKIITGLLLALAVTLKISPLAFLVFFFLMKRQWKILLYTLTGFGFFFFLFPSLFIGFHRNWELLKIWQGLMSISQSDEAYHSYLWAQLFTPFSNDNQSLYAVITRFAWPSEAQFIGYSNAFVRYITSGLGVLFLALPFFRTRSAASKTGQDPVALLTEFSLFPMLMLFTSSVTQIHHYTVTYFLFFTALLWMDRIPRGSRIRKCLGFSLWACALSLTLGMIFLKAGIWGVPLWGSMLLWGVVLLCLDRKSSV